MTTSPVRHADTIIFPASLDPKAVSVVERLTENGFESYLVGGCVRDLMLGHIPKDFDVSTAARPRQIRRLFRNCRIIGRRFKLAHVHFGDHIIEVATFRRNPSDKVGDEGDDGGDEDLLITRDNEFGNAEEDTVRRDFTINALLYDVGTGEVIDYVGGVPDLEARTLRTIGAAPVRIAEDPVRMLRAIKFASRLDLRFDEELDRAMRDSAELISRSAPPRVLEEIFKLLTCGRAEHSLAMLYDYGLLGRLLPEVAEAWDGQRDALVATGRALDAIDQGQRRLSNAFVLAALWHRPWRQAYDEALEDGDELDPMQLASDMIQPAAVRMNIPRRDVGEMKALITLQLRLERARRGRRFRMNDFLARRATQEAIDLMYLRALAGEDLSELHERWVARLVERFGEEGLAPTRSLSRGDGIDDGDDESEDDEAGERPRRRRRRRRSRGGRGRGRDRPSEGGPRQEQDDRVDADEEAPASRRGAGAQTDDTVGHARTAPAGPGVTPVGASPPPAAARGSSLPAPGPAGDADPAPGLRGLVGRLMRKVLGDKAAPLTAHPVTDASPGPGHRADADAAPDDTPVPEERPPRPFGPVLGAENQQEDEVPSEGGSGRRRRRRRRSRSRRRGEGETPRDPDAARAPYGPARDGTTDDAESDEAEASPSGSRRKRRRRRGGADRSGQDGGPSQAEGEGRRNGADRGSKRSSRRGGSGEGRRSGSRGSGQGKSSGKSGKPSGGQRAAPPRESLDETGPGQRHPEDVEDIFDW